MESQSRPLSSEKIGALAAALAAAQGEIQSPKKTKEGKVSGTNRHGSPYEYTYAYSDLADLVEAVRVPLSKNGLCFTQQIVEGELITSLIHSSGEWLRAYYDLPHIGDKVTAQVFGSAVTYGRRYSLSALLGVAAEDDDDGAVASKTDIPGKGFKKGNPPATGGSGPQQGAAPKAVDPKDFVINFTKGFKGKKLSEMKRADLEGLLEWCIDKNTMLDFQEAAIAYLDTLPEKEVQPPLTAGEQLFGDEGKDSPPETDPNEPLPPFDQFK